MRLQAERTKTQNAIELLRQSIASDSFQKGDRLPSTRTLARRLGVSQIVLRTAFKKLEEEGTLECRARSGVYLRQLPSRSKTVAILTELDISDPSSSFFHRCLIDKSKQQLEDAGFNARLHIGRQKMGSQDLGLKLAIDELTRGHDEIGYAAVIMVSGLLDADWRKKCLALKTPVIGPYYAADIFLRSSVILDTAGLIRSGVAALAAKKCRRPAFLTWDPANIPLFRELAQAAGMEFREEWVYSRDDDPRTNGFGYHGFLRVWEANSKERPDAALFADDILFMDARIAIAELGIPVPARLKVATLHNIGSDILIPYPATLLALDPESVAVELAAMAMELAGNPGAKGRQTVFAFKPIEHTPPRRILGATHD